MGVYTNGDILELLTVSTAPTTEPITTAEAKTHIRLEHTSDDTYIDTLIVTARQHCEQFTRRSFITQTMDLVLPYFPPRWIVLPRPPLVSVSYVKYIDTGGTTQTWDSGNYTADTAATPGRVIPAYNVDWPSARDDYNAVQVRYVAGYGAASDVPAAIKHAIKLLVGHWYEHRESVADGTTPTEVPSTVDALLWPYRVLVSS